ncbi:hypothetical protein PHAVU_006G126000 [Phaseolus vulgaris]|uniref:Uncharacterized protein n=1 Tax=Phaseolus vulgaris TaxID=3885 RepID=V7BN78_PHAVU|nr:hypothetical protein PHAVU_006G126000g [Phaseolus vulgaris]ESW19449.1 hypothetical protein PHAVU_006G126000g [Phaseolus vulgaris]
MPFPWKKNRVPRISQIVADLQSPKRGGSLVVETGFPTSLIDLFVKNRSRFKKHRSKKPPPPNVPDPPPPPTSPANSPPPQPYPCVPNPRIEQNVVASVSDQVAECSVNVILVVKILIVLIVVASVKRLTVGITVSTFALLLLEIAGRRVVSGSVVESWFQKVRVLKKERVRGSGFTDLTQLTFSENFLIDEIEVVSDVGVCREMRSISGDVASEVIEDCSSHVLEEVSEYKIKRSRSGRFGSRMMKMLVPKKFRGPGKEKKDKGNKEIDDESGSEFSSAVEEDKLPVLEVEEEDKNKDTEQDEVDCGITCSYNAKRVSRVGNSGSSMVLVMIALVGLLLGRFPALILSMTWCCTMKIVRTLWRSPNVSPKKCSVSNS